MSCRRSISLSLTANYAPSWKTWEGVREFVQNWHDGTLASLENTATGSTRVDFTKVGGPDWGKWASSRGGLSHPPWDQLVYRSDGVQVQEIHTSVPHDPSNVWRACPDPNLTVQGERAEGLTPVQQWVADNLGLLLD